MRILLAVLIAVVVTVSTFGQNVVVSLLAPTEPAVVGGEVRVDLVVLNPTGTEVVYETPLALAGRLTSDRKSWPIELRGQAGGGALVAARGFSYRAFIFTVPEGARGRLVLELDRPQLLRAVIDVREGGAVKPGSDNAPLISAPLSNILPSQPVTSAIQRAFVGRFSAHEPSYFVYGPKAPAAKFQFSFKYRLLGEEARAGAVVPALSGLHIAYTQRSLWDTEADSSPFFDTSYMPELIYESEANVDVGSRGGLKWMGYQVGVRHESNGRDGPGSRSLNTVYVRPGIAFGRFDSWNVIVAPRLHAYVGDLSDNRDVADYRGYGELLVVFGRNDYFALSATGRLGAKGGRGAVQVDLTAPLKIDRMFNFATYLYLQYWNGWGESLRTYDVKNESVRAGFSLVR